MNSFAGEVDILVQPTLIFWMLFFGANKWIIKKKIAWLFAGAFAILFISLLGGDFARYITRDRTVEHHFTTDNGEVIGKILRAGDRGILIKDSNTKDIRFV